MHGGACLLTLYRSVSERRLTNHRNRMREIESKARQDDHCRYFIKCDEHDPQIAQHTYIHTPMPAFPNLPHKCQRHAQRHPCPLSYNRLRQTTAHQEQARPATQVRMRKAGLVRPRLTPSRPKHQRCTPATALSNSLAHGPYHPIGRPPGTAERHMANSTNGKALRDPHTTTLLRARGSKSLVCRYFPQGARYRVSFLFRPRLSSVPKLFPQSLKTLGRRRCWEIRIQSSTCCGLRCGVTSEELLALGDFRAVELHRG